MKRLIYLLFVLTLVLGVVGAASASKGVHEDHANGGNGASQVHLQPGWDSRPSLASGKVIYNTPDSTGKLQLTYILNGSVPNMTAVVGLIELTESANPCSSDMFTNIQLGMAHGCGTYFREGNTISEEYWEIGYIETDEWGNGSAHFNLYPSSGSYDVQFFVWKVPGSGGVAYESGGTFGTTVPILIP